MTPMAAKLFRFGDLEQQRRLAGCQFFDCTALMAMAREMVTADLAAGCVEYSEMAQLPAPATGIEFQMGRGRVLMLAHQDANVITWEGYSDLMGAIKLTFECGFFLGSGENLPAQWDEESLDYWRRDSGMDRMAFASMQATGFNGLLEKLLCIINQPGLVDRRARDTNKRVMRIVASDGVDRPAPKWHECRIQPGVHGEARSAEPSGREHQLHYVRKHMKPSLGRWIEGYWRGNADLGLYLKHYTVAAPGRDM